MTWEFWLVLLGIFLVSTLIGSLAAKHFRQYGWGALTAMLAIYITGANVLVPRLVVFDFGIELVLVTGSIIFPFVSNVVDMVNEIYGRRKAYYAVIVAYAANLMFISFIILAFTMTAMWEPEQEEFFRDYFGILGRTLGASIASYIVAQGLNVYLFSKLKQRFMHHENTLLNATKFTFIRTWTSDVGVTLVENPIFYFLAMAWIIPWDVLGNLILTAMLAKLILSQIQQPFFLLYRWMTIRVPREA